MQRLKRPSHQVVHSVLSEVGFEERLVGIKMTQMGGNASHSLYSFQEVVNFLHFDNLEDLLAPGCKGSIGYIDLHALKQWVSGVMKDEPLAGALGEAIEQESNYRDQAIAVRELMETRLGQCKDAVEA